VRDAPPHGKVETDLRMPAGEQKILSGLTALFKKRDYWIISLGSFVGYGIYAAFQTLWAGPYLTEVMGLSVMNAGHVIFLMNLGAIAGGPCWAWVSDRLHTRKWVVAGGLVLLVLIMLLLARLSLPTTLMVLIMLFFAFGFFRSSGALMYVHIKETMPLEMAGTAMTGINFFTMIGPAVFLQGLGVLMQTLYPEASRGPEAFTTSFTLCAFLIFLVSVLYLFTKDTIKT